MPTRRGRSGRLARSGPIALVTVLIVLGGIAFGIGKLWDAARSATQSSGCDIGSYNLDLEQAQNASTMVGLVIKRNLPERAAVVSLMAGLQESKLRNIPSGDGDRDSVGILQQRPSQGWGTIAQISDVHYAAGKFLDALVKVDNWQGLPLADAIQEVQRSADGGAYAKHQTEAQVVSDALLGTTPAAVSCNFDKPTAVAAGSKIASQLAAELPVTAPTVSGSQIRVAGAGWATSAWLVAHANTFGLESVRYAGQQWSRGTGWKTSSAAELNAVTATLAVLPAK
jgi:hypothetical protein